MILFPLLFKIQPERRSVRLSIDARYKFVYLVIEIGTERMGEKMGKWTGCEFWARFNLGRIALKGGYCLPSSPAGSFARTASKQARKLSSLVESSSNGTIWPRARTSGSCGFLSTGSSSLSFCCSIALKIFIDGEFPEGSSRPTNTWTDNSYDINYLYTLFLNNTINNIFYFRI